MKKNGFTLVEMLTVIIILVSLGLISIFTINKIVKRSGDDLYDIQVNTIKEAARNYAVKNGSTLGASNERTICDLKRNNLIDEDLVDPRTEKPFDESLIIKIINDNSNYKIEFDGTTKMPNYSCGNDMVVTLVGDSPYYLSVGSKYVEPGISVKKKQNDTLVDYADYTLEIKADSFDKIGTYKVTYLVTDKNNSNSKVSLRRTVIVEDKEAPIITVNKTTKNYTQTILEGTKIDVPSCSAYDAYEGNLPCKVINNYNGNTNPGTYQVEYTATDSSGNSNSFILTIIVKKKNKNLIGKVNVSTLEWTSEEIKLEIEPLYNNTGCNTFIYTFDGANWQKTNTSTKDTNGSYRLGIKTDIDTDPTCSFYEDYFNFNITNIDKTAPDVTNLKIFTESDSEVNEISKSKEIDGKIVSIPYYYTSGSITISSIEGAVDNDSKVGSYSLYVNGTKENNIPLTLATPGRYVVSGSATDFANNESKIKELAVIIIDQEKPVCSFAKCDSLTDCNNNPPMINDNLVYAWGEYKLNFKNDVEQVFLKMSCTNTYYKEETDELSDYTVALSDVQIDYEVIGVTNPSQVVSTELLDAPTTCGAVFCTKTYNYLIGVDITKAATYDERVQVVLKKGAIKDLAFNINNSASSFMIIKNY